MIGSNVELSDYKEKILDLLRSFFRDEVFEFIELFEKFRDDVLLTDDELYKLEDFFRRVFSDIFYDELLSMGAEIDYQVGKYCVVCISEQFKKELCELILEFYEKGLFYWHDENDEEF